LQNTNRICGCQHFDWPHRPSKNQIKAIAELLKDFLLIYGLTRKTAKHIPIPCKRQEASKET